MKTHLKKLIIGVLIGFSCVAQAQVSLGLLGGFSIGAVKIRDLDRGFTDAINGDAVYGIEAGMYLKLKAAFLYVRPELLYDYRNGDVTYYDIPSNSSQTSSFSVHKIEVPLLVGLNILGPLNVEAGPVYNYLLFVTDNYHNNSVDLGKNGLGYRVGVNLELAGLLIGLSYQGAAYTSGSNNASFSEPYKVILGLGIRI